MKNRLLNYFIQGLLFTTPLALTGYVLFWALSTLDSILPFDFPGLGLLTLLVSITLIGFLGNFVVKNPLVTLLDGLLEKLPLVKLVYSSTKDVMKSLTGKKKGFEFAVLVRMSPNNEVRKVAIEPRGGRAFAGVDIDNLKEVVCPRRLRHGLCSPCPNDNGRNIHCSEELCGAPKRQNRRHHEVHHRGRSSGTV